MCCVAGTCVCAVARSLKVCPFVIAGPCGRAARSCAAAPGWQPFARCHQPMRVCRGRTRQRAREQSGDPEEGGCFLGWVGARWWRMDGSHADVGQAQGEGRTVVEESQVKVIWRLGTGRSDWEAWHRLK
eukprot:363217-Chlamydomonas_euryale.AAC.2